MSELPIEARRCLFPNPRSPPPAFNFPRNLPLESILQDEHLVATGYFPVVEHPTEGPIRSMKVSTTWSVTPAEPLRLAPQLNEHGEEILREAGFSADEIAAMVRDGVTIAVPAA